MEQTLAPSSGLYAQILGDHWRDVAASVRHLHDARGIHAAGSFRVRRGNRLARILAWLLCLPAEGDVVHLRLTVMPSPNREEWQRFFAETPFLTSQWAQGGCLVERVGLSETYLHLAALDGALHYRTRRVALRLGPWRLPVPRWLAPRVTASESPEGANVRVHVDVVLPVIGLLIAYDGLLTSIETRSC